jgi:sensor histidine kinase YesM
MHIIAWRHHVWMLVGMNLFVLLIQLVLVAASGSWETGELLRRMCSSLLYVNITAIPAMLILPKLVGKSARQTFPLVPITILWLLLFILAGCLAAQTLLWMIGVVRPHQFWMYYLRILPPVLSSALIFGLGAFIYGLLQERLHNAERKLQEKAIMDERAEKLASEIRLRSLEARLHPHFLFNALNSISSLIAENPVLAEQTVGRLASLLRASLDHTSQSLIPLRQEMAIIRDYIEIEGVRFGDKLRGTIDIPEELQDSKVPPFSIISLVENAVKHGITSQRGGGEVLLSAIAEQDTECLIIEVRDTGPAFDLASIPPGHGLDNLVARLQTIFDDRAYLKVFHRDGWCIVQMRIPLS